MTPFEYYGAESYNKLLATQHTLETLAEALKNERIEDDVQRIVYFTSRIKSPESMAEKLNRRGLKYEDALTAIYDAVGIRIICSFESDVHYVVKRTENDNRITVLEKKDYLSYPKPNGYRSIHLCVRLNESGVLAEIQVRTIAMDFWATLEHQLKYKKSINDEALIKSELKRCADEIASVDLSMQTIREIIKEV